MAARGDEVGLDDEVDERRALGGVPGEDVVGGGDGAAVIQGAYGQSGRLVAGAVDGAEAGADGAVVAGGDDGENTGVVGGSNGLAERVGGVRLEDGMAQRQVEDADVVVLLELDGPVDAGDDVGGVAGAVGAEGS